MKKTRIKDIVKVISLLDNSSLEELEKHVATMYDNDKKWQYIVDSCTKIVELIKQDDTLVLLPNVLGHNPLYIVDITEKVITIDDNRGDDPFSVYKKDLDTYSNDDLKYFFDTMKVFKLVK